MCLFICLLLPLAVHAVPMTGERSVNYLYSDDPIPTPTPPPRPSAPPPQPPDVLQVVEEAQPNLFNLRNSIVGSKNPRGIAMPAQDGYAQIEGVLTFRGGPYRQNAAYGYASAEEGILQIVWQKKIGALDNWSGVGWNGQPALVRWPEETMRVMNLYDEKKANSNLIEAIYATLDGKIYFLDLVDGTPTRDPIVVNFPIKGSVSVDPRGIPLLYSGQGISNLKSRSGAIGMRVFSLVTGEQLFMINGRDQDAIRNHGAFDSVPLLDAASDTLLFPGENGLLYAYTLGTQYDAQTGALSISPQRSAYKYYNSKGLGTENSLAVYGHFGYFADNGGLLQCIDLRTLQPVWAANVTDDTDASIALETRNDGTVLLYIGCEVDRQGSGGKAYIRCFDALTGALRWEYEEACIHDADLNGGVLGSPLVGEHEVEGLVYFHIAKTKEGGGALVAINKKTGMVVWRQNFPRYGWSSPVAIYSAEGKAHIILGDSGGNLRLMDAATGEVLDTLKLDGNIEGSPAVFGDMLVIGTRGRIIYGIKIL